VINGKGAGRGRRALSAPIFRTVMRRRLREWNVVSETAAFAATA
jgi:hypothetical protein